MSECRGGLGCSLLSRHFHQEHHAHVLVLQNVAVQDKVSRKSFVTRSEADSSGLRVRSATAIAVLRRAGRDDDGIRPLSGIAFVIQQLEGIHVYMEGVPGIARVL